MQDREKELMERLLEIENEIMIDEEKVTYSETVRKIIKEVEETYDI